MMGLPLQRVTAGHHSTKGQVVGRVLHFSVSKVSREQVLFQPALQRVKGGNGAYFHRYRAQLEGPSGHQTRYHLHPAPCNRLVVSALTPAAVLTRPAPRQPQVVHQEGCYANGFVTVTPLPEAVHGASKQLWPLRRLECVLTAGQVAEHEAKEAARLPAALRLEPLKLATGAPGAEVLAAIMTSQFVARLQWRLLFSNSKSSYSNQCSI